MIIDGTLIVVVYICCQLQLNYEKAQYTVKPVGKGPLTNRLRLPEGTLDFPMLDFSPGRFAEWVYQPIES